MKAPPAWAGRGRKETEDHARAVQQFMGVIQELQNKLEPLMREAQSGGNPHQIMPRAIKMREDYEKKVEAILTAAQRKQWKEILGKPCDTLHE